MKSKEIYKLSGAEVVFAKNYGRPPLSEFNSVTRRRRLLKSLTKLSKKHVIAQKRQVAIFAYDFIGHNINLEGVYELDQLEILFSWLENFKEQLKDGCAIDVGANIGNHSLYFSDFFKRVYSFEPNFRTYQVLTMNASLAKNIKCFNVGLSDHEGGAFLKTDPINVGGGGD